jgi:hypothetical protein
VGSLGDIPEGKASIFAAGVDPLLIERLRCRLMHDADSEPSFPGLPFVLRPGYPGSYTLLDDFFRTPMESRFIKVPFEMLTNAGQGGGGDEVVWLPFQGLGEHAQELDRKLTLNAFTAWSLVEGEMLAIQTDQFRYRVPVTDQHVQETVIVSVEDLGTDPATEYVDAASVADPGYPFQYTKSVQTGRGDIVLAMAPPPTGDVKVRYYQYDIGDLCINIAAGRSFGLYQGIDERIRSVQSLTPTHRLDVLNDKNRIWEYFRSMLASRNRWLSRDDIRAAVSLFPPFSTRRGIVAREKIRLEERVGRAPAGFLTPYTELLIPLREGALLKDPDRTYFERRLADYVRSRTVTGNFVRVKLVSADEV